MTIEQPPRQADTVATYIQNAAINPQGAINADNMVIHLSSQLVTRFIIEKNMLEHKTKEHSRKFLVLIFPSRSDGAQMHFVLR